MSLVLLILGLILFVGLVVLHELGHFLVARRNGVQVEEFGIGFPPTVWLKRIKSRKGDYDFTINALPLGGFVRLKGEHDADRKPGSFGAASLPAKIKVMVAGVVVNFLIGIVLLTFVALVGMPQFIEGQFTVPSDSKVAHQELLIAYVKPGSPAEKAGLKAQDRLLTLGPAEQQQQVNDADTFPDLTQKYAGQKVSITYKRGNRVQTATPTLLSRGEVEKSKQTDEPKGYLGIAPSEYVLRRSTWSAPIVALGLTKQFTIATLKGLGSAASNIVRGNGREASQNVSGPVGIFVVLKDGSLLGYQFVLFLVAIISLTLAIMNVLPIPALDGGRLFVTLLFRGIKRPLSQQTEDLIHGVGFAALMALFLLITVVDIRRFF
jgi:regulator of sigma E protease